ncbi:MAG: phosphopantetheine-binding protein [Pseudomonadales bacterium]
MSTGIIDQVREVVLSALDPELGTVSDEEELLLSGLLDSMAVISITSELEKRFQLEIQAMDITIENFESIVAMANFLAGQSND